MKLKSVIAALATLAAVPAGAGIIERSVSNTQTYMYAYEVCGFEFIDREYLLAALTVEDYLYKTKSPQLDYVALAAIGVQAQRHSDFGEELYCQMSLMLLTDNNGNPLFKKAEQ